MDRWLKGTGKLYEGTWYIVAIIRVALIQLMCLGSRVLQLVLLTHGASQGKPWCRDLYEIRSELWRASSPRPTPGHKVEGGKKAARWPQDSLFCNSSSLQSMWFPCRLTAFVYKSFAEATRYIYIDSNVQQRTLIWLASKQNPNGCFPKDGNHFNNALKVTDLSLFINSSPTHH